MRVAIYARVSADDKGQDPENQLRELRDWVINSGHVISREYVDYASHSLRRSMTSKASAP
jgi:DNA invertase Pin-like site-specific DNA recombinase